MSFSHWSYAKASQLARSLGIKSGAEFFRWAAGNDAARGPRPEGYPSNPHQVFDEWQGFPAFLGTKNVAPWKREFLPFEEARAFW